MRNHDGSLGYPILMQTHRESIRIDPIHLLGRAGPLCRSHNVSCRDRWVSRSNVFPQGAKLFRSKASLSNLVFPIFSSLVTKHGNGKSPINGGLNGNITYISNGIFALPLFDYKRVVPLSLSPTKSASM